MPLTDEERSERLALNIHDLDRLPAEERKKLLAGRIDPKGSIVWPYGEEAPESVAIPLTCPLLQAAILVDVIRSKDREAKREPCQVYIERDGEWVEVEKDAVFSTLYNGRFLLNHSVFPPAVIYYTQPLPKRFEF